jgi:hypothetical protein
VSTAVEARPGRSRAGPPPPPPPSAGEHSGNAWVSRPNAANQSHSGRSRLATSATPPRAGQRAADRLGDRHRGRAGQRDHQRQRGDREVGQPPSAGAAAGRSRPACRRAPGRPPRCRPPGHEEVHRQRGEQADRQQPRMQRRSTPRQRASQPGRPAPRGGTIGSYAPARRAGGRRSARPCGTPGPRVGGLDHRALDHPQVALARIHRHTLPQPQAAPHGRATPTARFRRSCATGCHAHAAGHRVVRTA